MSTRFIRIKGNLYQRCITFSHSCQSAHKNGSVFDIGCIGRYASNRIGKLGECAFAVIHNLDIDWKYRQLGDRGRDFTINGCEIDVKTASKPTSNKIYIRKKYISKFTKCIVDIPFAADIYVGARLIEETYSTDRCVGNAIIEIVGFATRKFASKLPIIKSPHQDANHYNIEVEFCKMLPLEQLRQFVRKQ